MKNIALMTYAMFDQWPRYADLFLESCRYNPTVDFFVLTSCLPPGRQLPVNVKVLNMNVQQFKARAEERLGMEVNLKWRYKIVDFKPVLGMIFEDVFSGYDFWGYCDVDDILGDLRAFLSEELLDSYDVICARKEFITGHFILFRNTAELARLYSHSRDWQKVCSTAKIFNFDECGWGLHERLIGGESFAEIAHEAEVECFMQVLARTPEVRVHLKTICSEYTLIERQPVHAKWQKGRLFDLAEDREVMYYHLLALKRQPAFYVPDWKVMPEAFMITLKGVFWMGDEEPRQRLATAVKRRFSTLERWFWVGFRFCLRKLIRFWRQSMVRFSAARAGGQESA